jgi:hypothetical protein
MKQIQKQIKIYIKGSNLFYKVSIALSFVVCSIINVHAQSAYIPTKEDKKALEAVIVEKYYTATETDIKDTVGGIIPEGTVVYRVYLDLLPKYTLQSVFGSEAHPLYIETSTSFHNDTHYGKSTGDKIVSKIFNRHNVILDSWLSMGAASDFYNGVLKSDDTDGTVITNKKDLSKVDGLLYGNVYSVVFFGNDLKFFLDSLQPKRFYTNNGAWANLKGAVGPTDDNKILIAQLATNGTLSFELNIQLGTPTGGTVQFVARKPENAEVIGKDLTFNVKR